MHAFTREQASAEFAVMALCGHISRPKSVRKGDGVQCLGCLVVVGETLAPNVRWQG